MVFDQHTKIDLSRIYANKAPEEGSLTTGAMLAPPMTNASISSSEIAGRPNMGGMYTRVGVWTPARRLAQPSFPRNLIDGVLWLLGGFVTACAAEGAGASFGGGEVFVSEGGGLLEDSAAAAVTDASASVSILYKSAPTSTVSSLH
jgi:hypothetical protein